jgi:hypothetical protein
MQAAVHQIVGAGDLGVLEARVFEPPLLAPLLPLVAAPPDDEPPTVPPPTPPPGRALLPDVAAGTPPTPLGTPGAEVPPLGPLIPLVPVPRGGAASHAAIASKHAMHQRAGGPSLRDTKELRGSGSDYRVTHVELSLRAARTAGDRVAVRVPV